jgi:serine/threonine protein kinase
MIRRKVKKETLLSKKYYIKDLIGKGSFGEVRKVILKTTMETRALKVIKKKKFGSDEKDLIV